MIGCLVALFVLWVVWPGGLALLAFVGVCMVILSLLAGAVERYKRVQRPEESERTCYTGKR